MGTIIGLFTCPDKGQPMISHQEVMLLKGAGIEGDRYELGLGAYSNTNPPKIRHVTIISSEAIEDANKELALVDLDPFPPELTRRNIVVSGVTNLNLFVDYEFYIGGVHMRGVELASPCHRPTVLADRRHKEFPVAFKDRGGIRAEVLSSGPIQLGYTLSLQGP